MKTGIVTVYDPQDYGNRLQNYAMHAILSELGLDCETLVPRQNKKTMYRKRKENSVRDLYNRDPAEAQQLSPAITRQLRFDEFEKSYVPVRNIDTVIFNPALAKDYEWLVTGGNNVWDPRNRNNLGKMDNNLLAFAQSRQRICMSPSVAAEDLLPQMREQYHGQWIRFPWLNVRFPEDARLIREVTGREADILMDPVLMIDAKHWQEMMKPLPGFDEQKAYSLVWLSENSELAEEIQTLISGFFPDEPYEQHFLGNWGVPPISTAGPMEFLYLLKNARVMVTDSYYGVVFSVIFGKPFVFSANPQMLSQGFCAVKKQVEAVLELLQIPYETAGDCIWAPHILEKNPADLSERVRSFALLKKMFRLDTTKSKGGSSR